MEKNVIVVDEAGNEYEATYPKRAKGLVKNGRARFIDEKTICLACPPKKSMEDKKMSENKETKKENKKETVQAETIAPVAENRPLTAREIFERISELQKQLAESANHSLFRLDDMLTSICCASDDVENREQVAEVCSVFKMRENTLTNMLSLYEKMYNDLNSENAQKIGLIKVAFDDQAKSIGKMELKPEDKFALMSDVTEKIAELTEKVLVPATKASAREKVVFELLRILRSKDCSKDSAMYASQALGEFLRDSDSI